MSAATPHSIAQPQAHATMARDDVFDLLRGLAALTANPMIAAVAEAVVRHPGAPLANALNHKQLACKMWLTERLAGIASGPFRHVLVCGGWLGVLPALLLAHEPRLVERVTTLDLDPGCRPVAETLNAQALAAGRFRALTADMMTADLERLAGPFPPIDLVVNTSCEHLADVRGWLGMLPQGMRVVLQSNDYVREPEHVSCVRDLAAFKEQTSLRHVADAAALEQRHYTRFMLIGTL